MSQTLEIVLSPKQRHELQSLVTRASESAGVVRRAHVVLWSADGVSEDHAVPAATVERVIELAMSPPPAGRTRWTTRLLGKEVDLSPGCVSDLLRRNGLKPHLVRTYGCARDTRVTTPYRTHAATSDAA